MFVQKVYDFIKDNELVSKKNTVLIGVSGGPDSLALLHYFAKLRKALGLHIIVAHVDHMFRGEESKQDMYFVEEICVRYRILCESISIDVAAYQQETGKSTQVAARDCRYGFYDEMMRKHQANVLALGHHGDDQVETILMRLVRGASEGGYGGMKVKRPFGTGMVIRPFLCVTKAEIETYCQEQHLVPRIDPSNTKGTYTRNRFRKLLPALKEENPLVHERFLQFSITTQEDEQFLQQLAKEAMEQVVKTQNQEKISISIFLFQSVAKPLQRRVIQLILSYLYINIPKSLSSLHIANILSFFQRAHPSGELNLPHGLRIIRTYDAGIFTFEPPVEKKEVYIPLPFHQEIFYGKDTFLIEIVSEKAAICHKNEFLCPLSDISLPISVRTRKDGDKMTVKGMKGRKKIKAIFIDEKIAKEERDTWPIVVDGKGEVLWLPHLKKSSLEENTAEIYVLIRYIARRKVFDDERRY